MLLKGCFLVIAILFLLGAIPSLWKKRYFLAANCLVISFVFAKAAELKFLRNILGLPNYAIFILGGLLAGSFFFIDQQFFGKRNYSYKDFWKEIF
jgi:Flp pilus assembly protein TadB